MACTTVLLSKPRDSPVHSKVVDSTVLGSRALGNTVFDCTEVQRTEVLTILLRV